MQIDWRASTWNQFGAAHKQQQEHEWKQTVPIAEEKISDANHLTATMPQKLYHLKNTSTCRKPVSSNSSRFSSSL